MAYKPPGTYARFVRNVSPVVNAGNSRIMAIAGTGINYYTVENEAITKSKTKPYDVLQHENVFEILNVSSRPIYNGLITSNNTIYYPSTDTQKGYKVKDNVISWDSLIDADITVDYKQAPNFYVHTGDNNTPIYNIEYSVDETALYPVEDGDWVIEVSYINEDDMDNTPKLGCYRIINANTSEIIGEYVVSDEVVTNEDGTYPIPGVKLVVKDTYIKNFDTNEQLVFVGDYIKIKTTAAKTETEAIAYKYNLSADEAISDLTVELTPSTVSGEGEDTVADDTTDDDTTPVKITQCTAQVNADYTLSDKFKLYIKTSEFENSPKEFTTEDLGKIYNVSLNGKKEYTFTEQELKTITGQTDLENAKYGVNVKFSTRKPTQREINNGTFDNDEGTTDTKTVMDVTFSWASFDGNSKYYIAYTDDNDKITNEISFTKATLTLPIGSFVKDSTTGDISSGTFKYYETNEKYVTKAVFGKYNYKVAGEDTPTYYDYYIGKIESDFVPTAPTSISEFKNARVAVTYNADSASSVYNEYTQFYVMACALDENGNVLDFAYDDSTSPANHISTDGSEIATTPISSIDNNDEDYAGVITSIDKNVNRVISLLSSVSSDEAGSEGNGTFYSAIDNIAVISNEQLYQGSAVYKVNIYSPEGGKNYFRIVRYVNGQLDGDWTDYAGGTSTFTKDENNHYIDNWDETPDTDIQTAKLYEIPADGDIFDIIPGVMFDFDTTTIPNIPNNSSVLIISSPRITNDYIPPEGSTYYVSYKYRKADADYEPKFFDNYDDIVAEYGNYDVSASSAVLNSLSLGAEIAFNNGVSQIVCVQARNNSDYEMQTAIDRLQKSIAGAANVATVVPLSTSDAVGAYLNNHVNLMSSYDYAKERMGYLGARIGQKINKLATKNDRTLGMTSIAESYDNERIVYVVPGAIKRQIRDLRTGRYNERTLPGCYAAVAVAAVGLSHDPAEPLTYKTIAGFTQLVDLYSEIEKNQLASSGCCVLEQNGNTIRIRHGITTCDDDVNSQEITLIQIKDYVIDACRTVTADTYIGRKLTQSIIADIKYTMESLLNNFVSQGIIINYSSLKVKRSSLDPRQVDVSFEIEAVYPLNWISIEFGFSAVS